MFLDSNSSMKVRRKYTSYYYNIIRIILMKCMVNMLSM
nr:MAG TPA: hypothetical protein [Crassvirales sp.]DAR56549.1 MAG TPA: hypothetical protein [Crassvirales sp.]